MVNLLSVIVGLDLRDKLCRSDEEAITRGFKVIIPAQAGIQTI